MPESKARYDLVDKTASRLTEENADCFRPPVDLDELLRRLDIELVARDFQNSISGLAFIDGTKKVISYNTGEATYRQRFTIAHELGHILLHHDANPSYDVHPVSFLRDQNSSTGEYWREIEANRFAASILMPENLVKQELQSLDQGQRDSMLISTLAERFKVSTEAMSIRLGAIGYYWAD